MKQSRIVVLAVAGVLASSVAFAQTAAPMKAAGHARIDANGDGVIDRAEAAKAPRLASRFDTLDTNRDGRLSRAELPMRKGHGRRGGMLQAADTDKDGRISRAEAQATGKLGDRFAQMDANKDGYLDRADWQLRANERKAAFFAGADANRDGSLTRDEFVVEQGARASEMREKFAQRAAAAGKQRAQRPMPTEAERQQRAAAMFDRLDANKDGRVTRAEFDAGKPHAGMRGKHGG